MFDFFKKMNSERAEMTHQSYVSPQVDNSSIDDENILNKPITEEEIRTCISKLKNHKAPGIDNIINEYITTTEDILMPVYIRVFNIIFMNGIFPDVWSKGIIVPIYKKGDKTNPDNYRGITLLSCLGKLFTSIINDRITKFVENNSILSEVQAGFRKGFSTTEQYFNLKCLIDSIMNSKKKLFCAFIDFKIAFDMVWRAGLWQKLLKYGLKGRCFTIILSMYESIKSCVIVNDDQSSFLDCNSGVRQGENLSPIFFALFLNDLESFMNSSGLHGVCLTEHNKRNDAIVYLKLLLLLYADDTVIFSDNHQGLQKALDNLEVYCKICKLTVNIDKTKVVVFERRKSKNKYNFYFNGKKVDLVESFKYLGIYFNSKGTFTDAKSILLSKRQRQ